MMERNERFDNERHRPRFNRNDRGRRFERRDRNFQRFDREERFDDSESGSRIEMGTGNEISDEEYKNYKTDAELEKKREIVIPGEVIVSGSEYLPGDFTLREGDNIIAVRFGLSEVAGRLARVIPLAGVYMPRKGNVVIGKVTDVTFNGWLIDINAPYQGFLPVAEANRFVNKNDLMEYLDFGDMVVAKVDSIKRKGIDITTRARGLGNLQDGISIEINPNKVPRIIGREGSMINLVKQETNCNIVVGQNGIIWIKGENVESELLAKKAIKFIVEKSFVEGLTEKVQEFFKENKGAK